MKKSSLLQEVLMKRLGPQAHLINMRLNHAVPASVRLLPAKEYRGAAIGINYDLRVYTGKARIVVQDITSRANINKVLAKQTMERKEKNNSIDFHQAPRRLIIDPWLVLRHSQSIFPFAFCLTPSNPRQSIKDRNVTDYFGSTSVAVGGAGAALEQIELGWVDGWMQHFVWSGLIPPS